MNEDNRYNWNKTALTCILTRQRYSGDAVNFSTTKYFRGRRNHYTAKSQRHIIENAHEMKIPKMIQVESMPTRKAGNRGLIKKVDK